MTFTFYCWSSWSRSYPPSRAYITHLLGSYYIRSLPCLLVPNREVHTLPYVLHHCISIYCISGLIRANAAAACVSYITKQPNTPTSHTNLLQRVGLGIPFHCLLLLHFLLIQNEISSQSSPILAHLSTDDQRLQSLSMTLMECWKMVSWTEANTSCLYSDCIDWCVRLQTDTADKTQAAHTV